MTARPAASLARARPTRWLWLLVPTIASLASLAVLLAALGAWLNPAGSRLGLLGSILWPLFGLHFVLASLVSVLVAAAALRRGPPRLSRLALLLGTAALLASSLVTGRIVWATVAAGGAIDPIRALRLAPMTSATPDATETFATRDGQDLEVSIFRPPSSGARAPVLLYFHGGGFKLGTRLETATDLRWFADQGWLVVTADYRLWTDDNPTWDKAPRDVACALAWTQANAARLGGDADRLALLGDSAGGNLALNLGYAAATGEAPSECGPVRAPQAIVVQYPAVDPVAIFDDGYPVPGFEPQMLVTGYLGAPPAEVPDRARAVSSATYLSDRAPPTLIIEPESDVLVPSASVFAFADRARAAGVPLDLVRIPHASHVYNQMAANSLGNQARLTITRRYLADLGLAPGDSSAD
jgi:acetyl esterase/lipase